MIDGATISLEVRGVSVERGERQLFSPQSFTLGCGEIVHLTGQNGSGKTSLLRVIAGLTEAAVGEVLFNGNTISAQRQAYAACVGWSGHKDGLKADLSVRENLEFDMALRGGVDRARLEQAFAELSMAGFVDLPVRVLSAGQRRRASLARILLSNAPIWLLDEPLTNLDANGIESVTDMLARHIATGCSAIVAFHGVLDPAVGPVRQIALTEPAR